MNPKIRAAVSARLQDKALSRADLARLIDRTPQEVTRALNGGPRGGSVPPIWQAMLDALGLELTVRPRGEGDAGA